MAYTKSSHPTSILGPTIPGTRYQVPEYIFYRYQVQVLCTCSSISDVSHQGANITILSQYKCLKTYGDNKRDTRKWPLSFLYHYFIVHVQYSFQNVISIGYVVRLCQKSTQNQPLFGSEEAKRCQVSNVNILNFRKSWLTCWHEVT